VTVIATGFGAEVEGEEPVPTLKVVPTATPPVRQKKKEAGPRLMQAGTAASTTEPRETVNPFSIEAKAVGRAPLEDLEIPTFIRRQMD